VPLRLRAVDFAKAPAAGDDVACHTA
jgi:hypothetical protein